MATPLTTGRSCRTFEGAWCDDGYDFIAAGDAAGWRAVSSWGVDGWDLLHWPYYVCLFRGETERATYCEGDVTIEVFESELTREASTDELALWHWTQHGEPWAVGPEKRAGADLRGPYRNGRNRSAA